MTELEQADEPRRELLVERGNVLDAMLHIGRHAAEAEDITLIW